jgi:hypothetical protein
LASVSIASVSYLFLLLYDLPCRRTLDNYSRAYSKFMALNEEGQARARQASADKAAEWVRLFKEPFTAIAAHLDTNGDPTDGLEAHLHACLGGNAHLHAIG